MKLKVVMDQYQKIQQQIAKKVTHHLLSELAAFLEPSAPIQLILTAVCYLLQIITKDQHFKHSEPLQLLNLENWKIIRYQMIKPSFLSQILSFNPLDYQHDVHIKKCSTSYVTLQLNKLNQKHLEQHISIVCSLLLQWYKQILKIYTLATSIGYFKAQHIWKKIQVKYNLYKMDGKYKSATIESIKQQEPYVSHNPKKPPVITSIGNVFANDIAEFIVGKILYEERQYSQIHVQKRNHIKHRYRTINELKIGIIGATTKNGLMLAKLLKVMSNHQCDIIGLTYEPKVATKYINAVYSIQIGNHTSKHTKSINISKFLSHKLDYIVNFLTMEYSCSYHLLTKEHFHVNYDKKVIPPYMISIGNPQFISLKDVNSLIEKKCLEVY